ncbi:hypothetical protein TR51_22585 [Kitasatospora griseola]|uniref:Uncharacterized protein n=1 Tax=Kitasatospora griseola TaxID=2064 RepID=A0A0D0PTN4_KITGR|nr:hypothetical protein [Kitasatospora griseola]KIQ61998.1 hypothetical protein TR51_22585 [Kitasatospora griseola]
MTPTATAPAVIRPLAAAHLRDALTAAATGDPAASLAALMNIDPDSWQAIQHRTAQLGTSVLDLIAHAARTGGTR